MMQNFFEFGLTDDGNIIKSIENEGAINLLESLSCKLSYINGSTKSGKSTLVNHYSKIHKAKIVTNLADLNFSTDNKIYFIDQNIFKFDPQLLFHFIQNIVTHDYFLYIFGEFDHNHKSTGIADLDSRLSLFNKFNINEPNSDLMTLLLKKYLKKNSISIDNSIIIEIPKFIDRTYLAVYNCANDINRLLYENNHNINLRLIKKFYNEV